MSGITGGAPGAVERRVVSVLFADLVGFTPLSERLDPEDVSIVQQEYFATARDAIARHGGVVEKFIGDAVVAMFGVPRARDDDAARAVRTALAMTAAVGELGSRLGLEADALRIRCGITSGDVAYRPSASAAEGMIVGDSVNTAARIQAAAPPGEVLIDEATMLATASIMESEEAGPLDLKGKSAPVRAWRVVGSRPEPSRDHAMGRLRAPLLGRERETAVLAAAVDQAERGAALRRVMVAPPGIGKTRLVDEFAASRSGAAVFRSHCRADSGTSLEPIAELMLSGIADGAPDDPARLLEEKLGRAGIPDSRRDVVLAESLHLLGSREAPDESDQAGVVQRRDARFSAWSTALDAIAAGRPAIWVVEDAHWAGGDVLAFLDRAEPARRLVVATARPSILERAPEWCTDDDERGVRTIQLEPLEAGDAQALVQALVGDALPPQLVEAIAERSDGNALFIEELLRAWVSGGLLVEQEGSFTLTAPASKVTIPATVQRIYAAQIDDLPPDARQTARCAAVAGRRFSPDALASLGVVDPSSAVEVLRVRALVAGPHTDVLLGRTFSFRHALLQDAGYASLGRAERAELHVRMARWLEGSTGDRADEAAESIAGHYAEALSSAPSLSASVAEGLDRTEGARLAGDWFERAGKRAASLAASTAASTLFRRALDFTETPEDCARRLRSLGEVVAFSSSMVEGRAAIEEALSIYREQRAAHPDPDHLRDAYAEAAIALGSVLDRQIQFDAMELLADETLREIGERRDAATAALLAMRGTACMLRLDDESAEEDARRALEIAREGGFEDVELRATEVLARSATGPQKLIERFEELGRLARKLGRHGTAVAAMHSIASLLSDSRKGAAATGTMPRTRGLLAQAHELAVAHELSEMLAWNGYYAAEFAALTGDWNETIGRGTAAVDLGERNSYHRAVIRTWHVLAPIATLRGERALTARAARWFEAIAGTLPDTPYARVMDRATQVSLERAGHGRADVPEVDWFLPSLDEQIGGVSWVMAVETLIERWIDRGELEAARRALDAPGFADPDSSMLYGGVHALLLARLSLAGSAEAAEAERHALAAIDRLRRCAAVWWISKAIRVLERVGRAGPEKIEEADRIEAALGLASAGAG